MLYSLRPNLSYCMIDGQAIFLDIDEGRYFRLEGRLEKAFLAYVNADGDHAACVDALIDHAILVSGLAPDPSTDPLPSPCRSSLELAAASGSTGIATFLEVFAIVWRMHRHLETRTLKDILEQLGLSRERQSLRPFLSDSSETQALDAARRFTRSRLFVPIQTCCLLDSLALTRYLTRHGVSANIVFGVTRDPFSAHCWVQKGHLVLNDTVGNVTAYTPIRVT